MHRHSVQHIAFSGASILNRNNVQNSTAIHRHSIQHKAFSGASYVFGMINKAPTSLESLRKLLFLWNA
jgi:hypothetical protein